MPTNKPTHELPKEDSPEFIGPKQPKIPDPTTPPVEPPKQPKPEEPEQDSHPEEV